ncbi:MULTISPECIES: histidine kinase [unclassified Rhodococcus (in: high G+C Gram-positive bacteria)]|uniref:sensor histidine kinase n=1 Tax=unclassified Rhodococcus (in: high G+C Gram-positive bacteria) TaxID=192944 RepID=UPI00163A9449|nr:MULTISPECIES: histidine kinase [unclassified Rhodococcus (in: high G+C Gram-positive bacteria)]MBC2642594.1 two-component sensor histidine kinase [Rhodococcus sp. 3A]MBC2892664.1 two-component sensor histidine kinase [Rhodococcus sp. 4CII]
MAESDYDYPLGVPLFAHIGGVVVAGAAVAQRNGFVPPGWILLCGLVAAVTPVLGDMIRPGVVLPRPLLAVVVTAAASLLLLQQPDTAFDFAPLILVILTGEVAATATLTVSVATLFGTLAVLSGFALAGRLDGAQYALAGVVLGWALGHLMLTQLRLLHQERASQTIQAEQAATRERQRIAREVHDVIAHSLSITLLHLTAARRALEQDRDVDDAVDALSDAERLGRQAMADIRRTVGLLDVGPAGTRPEPGVGDLPGLIDDFRRAGLPVTFDLRGDLSAVTGAVGLGIYRITQESLANVAKHAPGASTDVRLAIATDSATLTIRNPTPDAVTPPDGSTGSGLRGMRERAALLGGRLRAGPDVAGWSVHAAVPLPRDSCRPAILRHLPGLS